MAMEEQVLTRNLSSSSAVYYSATTRSLSPASDYSPVSPPSARILHTHQPLASDSSFSDSPNPSASQTWHTHLANASDSSVLGLLRPSLLQTRRTQLPVASDGSMVDHRNPSAPRTGRTHLPDSSFLSSLPSLGGLNGHPFTGDDSSHHADVDDSSSNYSWGRADGDPPGWHRDSLSSPSARLRSCCDVYIGFCGFKPSLIQFVSWLRAELELQGVLCFASDRSRCPDARAHSLARGAMDEATLGVVVVTRRTFSNPYSMEEVRVFFERKNLVPIFFGLRQGECLVRDIVERRGELWEKQGGELWEAYGGLEKEWREVVNGLCRMDLKLEAHVGNWRDCILEAVILIGTRLGRRSVVERVRRWKESAEKMEHPYPRNDSFVGRKKELLELELMLFGDVEGHGETECFELRSGRRLRRDPMIVETSVKERVAKQSLDRKGKAKEPAFWKESKGEIEMEGVRGGEMQYRFSRERSRSRQARRRRSMNVQYGKGIACVSGDSGIGKTELLLEFAYRFSQRYKMVLWVGGEARYIRQNYLNLLSSLGVDVSIENEICPERNGPRSFEELEEQAIRRVRKELMRDIPFLVMIDNLEAEKDWWDGRNIMELLPRFGGETHVIISTRLPRVMNLEPLRLLYLSGAESMLLMKGSFQKLPTEEVDALRTIEEKLGRVTLGLALVGALLTELPIGPQKLLETVDRMPYRDLTWSGREDLALRHHPFLVQLLDVCLSILDLAADKSKNLASRMVQASGWFAPPPIPISLLACAACEIPKERHGAHFWKKCLRAVTCMFTTSHANSLELEASAILLRFRIARSSSKDGFINFHEIIKLYARKRGKTSAAYVMVSAINIKGSLPHHSEHLWAACFLLFKFGTDPAVVDLKVPELVSLIKRFVLPLAMDTFTVYSRCNAALELLRLSTEALEAVDDSFLSEANKALERPSCWRSSSSRSITEFDQFLYQDFALLRATLLETRAKLMLRGGLYDIGEQLCKTAISIKEVFYGWEHPETVSARETMARLTRFHTKF